MKTNNQQDKLYKSDILNKPIPIFASLKFKTLTNNTFEGLLQYIFLNEMLLFCLGIM